MVLGATGNVGGRIVQLLVQSPHCRRVVVPTRSATNLGQLDPKVVEVVVSSMDRLEEEIAPHAAGVDVALAAFGVGKGSASMPEAEVRQIEIGYPLAFLRAAKAAGARVGGIMTSVGADPGSWIKGVRIIGEKEAAARSVGFEFLGVYRPAVILGNSNTPTALGHAMPLLHWAMPARYRSIHKNDLARAMVAQSEEAFLAGLAVAKTPEQALGPGTGTSTVKVLEYPEMRRFFVEGDCDEKPK
eukprot:TRINITY_DN7598_c0_g1_i4.p2 TRINITY_DN7598_c0_g1~~TRINITY_DN7598_c0_g1_i4.p2  ORF type:complete len:273 (+),score=45.59 TRINITY_DN7598_c0_g1_i4:93-821(+)